MLVELAFLLFAAASAFAVPNATVLNGTYTGVSLPQLSQEIFLGIPFASAPRLDLAQSLNETWNGTRNATTYGLVCAGFGTNPRENWPIGEDCLNLNIARPEGTHPGFKLPVLVWIYGGGFRQGANRDPEFNISYMVQTSIEIGHPLVVVAINYRLSGFGFLTSNKMQLNGLTNIGLRDQWKALEWINENIGAFGGDKDRVTIWGESAGAMSVASLSEAYGGDNKGLWRGGIMASGSFIYPYSTLTAQQTLYDNVTKELDCYYAIDSLQCLRNTSFEKLNATFYALDEGQDFTPYVDGEFIVNGPLYNFANKKVAPINFITGCNSDEGLIFTGVAPNTSIEVSTFLQSYFDIDNATAYEMMSVYPLDGPLPPYSVSSSIDWVNLTAAVGVYTGTQTRRLYGIFGDYEFHVGRRMTASSWNSITGKHAYSYRFDTDVTRFPLVVTPGLGVGFSEHGAELSFEFRLPYVSPTPYPPLPNITSMQRESYAMQACWASFAATGSPNNHGLSWIPYWPAYDESPSNFVFNATINDTLNLHIEDDNYRVKQLKWWDEHLRMWTF